jgi:transcriptional regulator with XRE-family HTH domain
MIGHRIKNVRKFMKLKQQEFSSRIGITQTHLSQVETGVASPGPGLIARIADTFKVNSEWLRTGKGSMFRGDIEATPTVNESHAPYNVSPFPPHIQELLAAAAEILLSDDEIIKTALKTNIVAFRHAISCDKDIKVLKREVEALKTIINPIEPPGGVKEG